MKAEDKLKLFNLLKTTDSYYAGYETNAYKITPVFSDDEIESENAEVIEQKNKTEVLKIETQTIQEKSEPSVTEPLHETSQEIPIVTTNTTSTASSNKATLADINQKIARCTRCQLARTRNNVVPGQGIEQPQVLVIGEGPGEEEDLQGLPFVGKAGILLDKMLSAIQLDRNQNCYIANIVKCRPPQNRNPLPAEQDACFSFLEAQIHILKPKMILCMGRIAGQKILKTEAAVSNLRGKFFEYNNIPVLVTYHPSALLRNEDLKRPAWEDLKLFRKKLDEILRNNS